MNQLVKLAREPIGNAPVASGILQNLALRGDFLVHSTSEFKRLQPNFLRNGTRNFCSHNREFSSKNREFRAGNRAFSFRTNILTKRARSFPGMCLS
jgi:hypothetical protein